MCGRPQPTAMRQFYPASILHHFSTEAPEGVGGVRNRHTAHFALAEGYQWRG